MTQAPLNTRDNMDDFNNEIRIVLFGKTGTGKSSTGNTILNREEFKTECQGLAVTDKSSFETKILNGKRLIVVDTPGFLDTHRNSEEMKTEILRSVGIFVPGPHAFLFVMRDGDRLTDDDQNCIQLFTEMFGEQVFKYAVVVFTRGRDLNGKPLSQYCEEVPVLFRSLLAKCSHRVITFDNTGTNFEKTEAVDTLLGMIDNMIYGQTYYSNDMLLSSQVPFMARYIEIRQADAVRKEIAGRGSAFKNVVRSRFFGPVIIGILIAGASITVVNEVRSVLADKFKIRNVVGLIIKAIVGGATFVAANIGKVEDVSLKIAVAVLQMSRNT